MVAHNPAACSFDTSTSMDSRLPADTTALPSLCTCIMSLVACGSLYPNSFWKTYVTYVMRLTGSSHTMVTHGVSVASTVETSRCSRVPGRILAGVTMCFRIPRPRNRYRCGVTAALLTDKYELTMLAAALRDGSAHRRTTFELFARRLPEGRRYGVVAGTARFVEALPQFRFDDTALASLEDFLDRETLAYLADYRFSGDVDGYTEGELYFPGSPVLSVHGTFGECVVLETLALSIFNHDTAIASACARMASAAKDRPLIEMGSRRTHEQAAVAAARAAYIAGFTASSNLEAQRRYGVPAEGTAAHAFTMLHTPRDGPPEKGELGAFRAQVD